MCRKAPEGEIEVTDEMIAVGVDEVRCRYLSVVGADAADLEEVVRHVFRSMLAERRKRSLLE
jgi:hypothetical protein